MFHAKIQKDHNLRVNGRYAKSASITNGAFAFHTFADGMDVKHHVDFNVFNKKLCHKGERAGAAEHHVSIHSMQALYQHISTKAHHHMKYSSNRNKSIQDTSSSPVWTPHCRIIQTFFEDTQEVSQNGSGITVT